MPGGVGPVEMAVLMERIVRQEADPNLRPWALPPASPRTRAQTTTRAAFPTRNPSPSRTPPRREPPPPPPIPTPPRRPR
ncbi:MULTISPECIES: hypothetical protein [Frankia]|uniref:hypothetical protein n=2 Tax=Frankia TaxID=1854 RepID=UPI000562158A|nr:MULTISPECIES: hypothetical protein [Frankia]OFB44290.1 hypothetical protein Manayef4_09255 [Frankia sp. CgIM4]